MRPVNTALTLLRVCCGLTVQGGKELSHLPLKFGKEEFRHVCVCLPWQDSGMISIQSMGVEEADGILARDVTACFIGLHSDTAVRRTFTLKATGGS